MKLGRIVEVSLLTLALVACTPESPAPTVTAQPPTPVPSAAPTSTPSPQPTLAPTPTFEAPDHVVYDIAADVPPAEVEKLKEGVAITHHYLERTMGGDDTLSFGNVTFKIVATGLGNPEQGVPGCCMALDPDGNARPFIDVINVEYLDHQSNLPDYYDKAQIAAHEYAHGWQAAVGCVGARVNPSQPLGRWLSEGMAEYLSHSAMEEAGYGAPGSAVDHYLQKMRTVTLTPLRETMDQLDSGGYYAAYVAVDYLVAKIGDPLSMRTLCHQINENLKQGMIRDVALELAFEQAFSTDPSQPYTMDAFYADFEQYEAEKEVTGNPSICHQASVTDGAAILTCLGRFGLVSDIPGFTKNSTLYKFRLDNVDPNQIMSITCDNCPTHDNTGRWDNTLYLILKATVKSDTYTFTVTLGDSSVLSIEIDHTQP